MNTDEYENGKKTLHEMLSILREDTASLDDAANVAQAELNSDGAISEQRIDRLGASVHNVHKTASACIELSKALEEWK